MVTTRNFYPVFENGQVLTAPTLNEIVDFLEPQDRLTRSRLSGVGVVCGLSVDWTGSVLVIGKGVAVTSDGYLIAEQAVSLDRVRPYSVPQPDAESATEEEKLEARYPFLFDGRTQRAAFELLPASFVPAPGEPAPQELTDGFVADKTVLLFLERSRTSLRNCDINDCSDKGSELSVTLRRLLIDRATADLILEEEAEIAGRTVDRASHPRLQLEPVEMEKLNLLAAGVGTWPALVARQVDTALSLLESAQTTGRAAFDAYRPLLAPLWPADVFPQGPVPPGHLTPPLVHWTMMPVLGQCLYEAAHATTLALDEFLAAAALHDAECAPDTRRFPRHVLLGDAAARPRAFAGAPTKPSDVAGFDATAIRAGAVPDVPPAPRRHHFVPSPLCTDTHCEELRSLFQRFVLLAQSYDTRGLVGATVRITGSRDTHAPLGGRAIPSWLRFDTSGDLFANWSWPRARSLTSSGISAYALTPDALPDHPLVLRDDSVDFYRVEGLVGRPLGSTFAELVRQKRELGLSFAIQPVLVPAGIDGDGEAAQIAFRAMRPLLLCRMRELQIVLLASLRNLFALMTWLVRTLGPLDATRATKGRTTPATVGLLVNRAAPARANTIELDLAGRKSLEDVTDDVLTRLRGLSRAPSDLVKRVAFPDAEVETPALAVAALFDRARDPAAGGELIDRVVIAAREADATVDGEATYPAVALLARAEEVMAATSIESIGELDQSRLTTATRGLIDAYDAFVDRAETDPAKAGAEAAAANTAIIENRATIVAAAQQLAGTAVAKELERRAAELFEEQTLRRWLRTHPGAEHKGGVPVGGTLALLYVPRKVLEPALGSLGRGLVDVRRRLEQLLARAPAPDLRAALEALQSASVPATDDALEELVIVGDLCVPTSCCDGECSESTVFDRYLGGRKPTPPEPTRPVPTPTRRRTGTVKGQVVIPSRGGARPAPGAELTVTDASGNVSRSQLANGVFSLVLPIGKYQLQGALGGSATQREIVVVEADAVVETVLTIGG